MIVTKLISLFLICGLSKINLLTIKNIGGINVMGNKKIGPHLFVYHFLHEAQCFPQTIATCVRHKETEVKKVFSLLCGLMKLFVSSGHKNPPIK